MKHTPGSSDRFRSSYDAARRGVATLERSGSSWVAVSGNDRRSYLQGLLTNDIASLAAGQGCYAAYLTPQGRMIADLAVYELGDVLLLGMVDAVKETVMNKLDQFIFSEDVRLGDVTSSFATVSVIGPQAASAVAAVLGVAPEPGAYTNARGLFHGEPAFALATDAFGVQAFDLLVDAGRAADLLSALRQRGGVEADGEVAETLRIEGGIPRFRQDMDEETIPLEAGLEQRAISFSKGCYVGQEVVIRILHRGHGRVVKKLVGLLVAGSEVPSRGAAIAAADRPIGEVTSATWSPLMAAPIALGYVHRDFVAPGTSLRLGDLEARVVELPFHQ